MVDFRSHEEKQRDLKDVKRQAEQDLQDSKQNAKQKETEAQLALLRMEPQIKDYKAEVKSLLGQVKELRAENQHLVKTLKKQMQGVEKIKSFLLKRMDGISDDIEQVHRKIISGAEDDMRLVKQMSDNQNDRLANLTAMVKGGEGD